MKADEIQTVVEDLEYLISAWNGSSVSDSEVRRGSAVLRRLLVEDAYGRAWRAVGLHGEPRIRAVDLKNILRGASFSEVDLALRGGAEVNHIKVATITDRRRRAAETFSPPITEDGSPGERDFTLSEYLPSEAGIVKDHSATRRDVIKYFANVKGGVHLGSTNKKREAKLVKRMEKFEKRVRVLKKDGLFFELIAIGQALARSPDTRCFLERAGRK